MGLHLAAESALIRPLEAPGLRTDPYRLLFPLGVMVAVVGVGQWLLFSLGLDPTFRSIFHSMAQVQGFLGCFAAGFLLTFIPRRTMTGPLPVSHSDSPGRGTFTSSTGAR